MLFRTLIVAVLCFLTSCSKGSIDYIFRKLPNHHQLDAAETEAVRAGLGQFLRLDQNATLEIKASGDPNTVLYVCGLVDGKRFFIGSLYKTNDDFRFDVKHASAADLSETTYEIEIRRLCLH